MTNPFAFAQSRVLPRPPSAPAADDALVRNSAAVGRQPASTYGARNA